MSVHPARIVASLSLLAGGFVVGVAVLAIGSAGLLVNGGMTVRPSEAALLDDLVGVLPFVAGFAILSLVSGLGLAVGHPSAEPVAAGISIVAVSAGLIGLALIVVGRDPFAAAGTGSIADGIGIVGAFTVVYIVVLGALAAARADVTTRTTSTAVAS